MTASQRPDAERTIYRIGAEDRSGIACENCGASYAACSRKILVRKSTACCGPCGHHDTHEERPASQQPDAEHAPLTSPAAAGSGPTGHDKAVELVASAEVAAIRDYTGIRDADEMWSYSIVKAAGISAPAILATLRAALAAGDPDVAEALGLRADRPEWGVRFADGSVRHVWNGRTAREHAEKSAAFLRERYAPDRIVLVHRSTHHTEWREA